ncbi:hypothetical protein ACJX0J_005516, partial [Zea mays]
YSIRLLPTYFKKNTGVTVCCFLLNVSLELKSRFEFDKDFKWISVVNVVAKGQMKRPLEDVERGTNAIYLFICF